MGITMPFLDETLGQLDNPCVDRIKLNSLTDILVFPVLEGICNADCFVAIATFGQLNNERLRTFLELSNGIPSHDM